jgi:hypothetical protein
MKVRYKSDRVDVEVDGKDTKDCFTQLAGAVEVFGNTICGACDSPRTIPVVRENGGNLFFEQRCLDCNSSLGYGQKRSDGSLFPKKKKDDTWLPHNGWVKFQPKQTTLADEPF